MTHHVTRTAASMGGVLLRPAAPGAGCCADPAGCGAAPAAGRRGRPGADGTRLARRMQGRRTCGPGSEPRGRECARTRARAPTPAPGASPRPPARATPALPGDDRLRRQDRRNAVEVNGERELQAALAAAPNGDSYLYDRSTRTWYY